MAAGKSPRQGILSLTIKDKSALYAAYMPFVKNGGLFIPTNKAYNLGDEVFMQFGAQDNGQTRSKIESFLAGAMNSDRMTHTM